MILTAIIFIIILSLLILVHEVGHFALAKFFGVRVEEFGIGFPPRMTAFKKKETTYSINWIPLGGFVKLKGEQGDHSEEKDSFVHQNIWRRIAIVSSGVLMNIFFSVILLGIGFIIGTPQVIDNIPPGAILSNRAIQIVSILPDAPAFRAGITPGDEIISLDGKNFPSVEELRSYIQEKKDTTIEVKVRRDEKEMGFTVVSEFLEEIQTFGLGIGMAETARVSYPVFRAFFEGGKSTAIFTQQILAGFYQLFSDLFSRRPVSLEVAGPVGIAVLTGEVAHMGFIYLLQFTALLSLNLAIINFIPFPALDGGRALFLCVEKIRGRAMNQRIENIIHSIGFALLIFLVLLVTFRDIIKLF